MSLRMAGAMRWSGSWLMEIARWLADGSPPIGRRQTDAYTASRPGEPPPTSPGIDFVFDECQLQLGRQIRDVDATDAKAIGVVSAASVVLAIVPATHFAVHDPSTMSGWYSWRPNPSRCSWVCWSASAGAMAQRGR